MTPGRPFSFLARVCDVSRVYSATHGVVCAQAPKYGVDVHDMYMWTRSANHGVVCAQAPKYGVDVHDMYM